MSDPILFEGSVYQPERIGGVRRFGRTIYLEVDGQLEPVECYPDVDLAAEARRYLLGRIRHAA